MNSIRTLVANMDKEFIKEIVRVSDENKAIDVVAIAIDGEEAKEKIDKFSPDIVVVDVLLTKIDGIGVVEYINTLKKKPLIVITSAMINKTISKLLIERGVEIIIQRPIDIDVLIMKIKNYYDSCMKLKNEMIEVNKISRKIINQDFEEGNLQKIVRAKIQQFGIKPIHKGYIFLIEIIINQIKNKDYGYKDLAAELMTPENIIIRDIKYAISNGYNNNRELYKKAFGKNNDIKSINQEFIKNFINTLVVSIEKNKEIM